MTALIFLVSAALAEPPALYAGLPIARIQPLGFEPPTLSRVNGEVRFALPAGGFAAMIVADDVDAAKQVFLGRMQTSATRWPPADRGLIGDEAVGDGEQILLVRHVNAVLLVSSPEDKGAIDVATRVLEQLSTDPADCAPILRTDDDALRGATTWNACGQRVDP